MYEKHAPKQAVYDITVIEEDIIAQLAAIVYATGDIFYYNGSDIVKLSVGSESQILKVSGGLPIWDDAPSSMIYPGAGIPFSVGNAWGPSIVDASGNWNTAYGWGNHASAGYVTGTPWTAMGYYIGDGSAFATAAQGLLADTAVQGTPWTGMGYLTTLSFSGLSDYPANAAGALTNNGAGVLSWEAVGASGISEELAIAYSVIL